MAYFKHIFHQLEELLVLTSIVMLITVLITLSVNIISYIT